MKLLRVTALLLAPGVALVSCGDRFEGSPTFHPVGGQAGSSGGNDGGNAGKGAGDNAGSAGSGADASGGSAGSASGGNAGNTSGGSPSTGMAGEAGFGGEPVSPEPPVATEGLVLWLRADQGVLQHAGGLVHGWSDLSGSANDATQTAENVMPKLDPVGLGGLPALLFDEDDFLRLPAGFSDFSQGLSVFAVAQFDQDVCVGLLTLSNGAEIDDISVGRYNGGLLYEVADTWNESTPLAVAAPTLLTVVHRTSEAIELRVNQMLGEEPSFALPALVERLENVVGRSGYEGCGALQGKLSELLVYTRAVSDDELVAVEDYLQAQWSCCE